MAECRGPEFYLPCGPSCEPNCRTNLTIPQQCGGCKRGCFCPSGLVRNLHGKCIPPAECTSLEGNYNIFSALS